MWILGFAAQGSSVYNVGLRPQESTVSQFHSPRSRMCPIPVAPNRTASNGMNPELHPEPFQRGAFLSAFLYGENR